MRARTAEEPRRWPIWLVIGAQVALLAGIGIYASRFDWSAPLSEQLVILAGPLILIAGTLAWWRWGSRLPLVIGDTWLAIYGASVLMLISTVDFGGPVDLTLPVVVGLLWLVGGAVGAVAAWRVRR